jgi:hypothetical protein
MSFTEELPITDFGFGTSRFFFAMVTSDLTKIPGGWFRGIEQPAL